MLGGTDSSKSMSENLNLEPRQAVERTQETTKTQGTGGAFPCHVCPQKGERTEHRARRALNWKHTTQERGWAGGPSFLIFSRKSREKEKRAKEKWTRGSKGGATQIWKV